MLVNAGTLAEDGTPVRFAPLSEMPTRFTWWHVELENHEVILANGGGPAESFIDYAGRSGFDNYDEYLEIAGADRLIPEMPFARISARRLLPSIARRPLVTAPGKPPPDATLMAAAWRRLLERFQAGPGPDRIGMQSGGSPTQTRACPAATTHPGRPRCIAFRTDRRNQSPWTNGDGTRTA